MKKKVQLSISHIIILMIIIEVILIFVEILMVGSSNMTLKEAINGLFLNGTNAQNRIIWSIRIPRVLSAIIAGAALSMSGLIMQTTLGNDMAAPSTLGVSNAAVFGANISIIVLAGGFASIGGNANNMITMANPFASSTMAFIFSFISILLILGLGKTKAFSKSSLILSGIAISSIWSALTTLIQFYATDVGLSAAVVWTFGDLGRATYLTDLIMLIVTIIAFIIFYLLKQHYNALLSGDNVALSLGVKVEKLRFISLILASLLCAVCVSYLGIIGFVGIICPHVVKRLIGKNHKYTIPMSLISGSILLLFADMISRIIGNGSALPIGAVTSILGAPFFLYIIFAKKEKINAGN